MIYVWTIVVLEKLTNVSKVHSWDLKNFFRLGKRYNFFLEKEKFWNGKHHRHAYWKTLKTSTSAETCIVVGEKVQRLPVKSKKEMSKVWLQDLKSKRFRPLSVIMTMILIPCGIVPTDACTIFEKTWYENCFVFWRVWYLPKVSQS